MAARVKTDVPSRRRNPKNAPPDSQNRPPAPALRPDPHSADAHSAEPDPCTLARQLVTECQQSERRESTRLEHGCEILLDTEFNGVRCVVSRPTPQQADGQVELTPREQEVARMVARGLPNKTIAAVLEISQWTVGTYLRRMFAKLGVNSRAALVSRLIERRLLGNS